VREGYAALADKVVGFNAEVIEIREALAEGGEPEDDRPIAEA
jgi:hypothetical protein